MSVSSLYRCIRSLEAIKNYAVAMNWSVSMRTLKRGSQEGRFERSFSPYRTQWSRNNSRWGDRQHQLYTDGQFWKMVFAPSNGKSYGHTFSFSSCALSEWVARIPGLFWSSGASALRTLAENAIEFKSEQWTIYHPLGKSQLVMGGVGTVKFPPDTLGNRLVTLSCGHNASSGIPAVISSHVWDYYGLEEGDVINGEAKWQRIPGGWDDRFPSIRGIPRGCLVIHDPSQIHFIVSKKQPVQFHPCTVMEYHIGDALLYDFVYVTADTSVEDYRQHLEKFFDEYKVSNERYGRYLLPADHCEPLFDADYHDLSRPESRSQLRLLEQRVRLRSFQGQTLDDLVHVMASRCTNDDLQAISRDMPLNPNVWFTGEAAARSAVQLLEACLQRDKVDILIDALARFNPALVA